MYDLGDFYQSYHEHGCTILPEKDVTETDIHSSERISRLRRWWFDLFLLSYTDTRAQLYYNSSFAIRIERKKHFRYHKNCIHPLSKFRNFWDFTMLLVMIMNSVLIHHATIYTAGQFPLAIYALGIFFEGLIIIDIYITIKCGYIDDTTGKIVLDVRKSLIRYCSTKLLFHVASAIPILTITFFRYGWNMTCTVCKANKFVCTLNVIGIIKFFRVYEASLCLTRERNNFKVVRVCRFLQIGLLAILAILQYFGIKHVVNVLEFLDTGLIDKRTLFYYLNHKIIIPPTATNTYLFTVTFARIIRILLYFNYGYNISVRRSDRISTIICYFATSAFQMYCLLEVFACVSRKRFAEDHLICKSIAARNMSMCRQLPDKIALKLKSYYDFNMTKYRIVEQHNKFFKSFPIAVKREIVINSYIRKVTRIPYFAEWPMRMMENLILLLKEEIYLKNDTVCECGVPGNGMIIVDAGVMAVYTSDGEEKGHLIDGDYFGELSLIIDNERRTSSVLAVTTTKVLVLEKGAFRLFMREYPKLFFEMKQSIRDLYLGTVSSLDSTGVKTQSS